MASHGKAWLASIQPSKLASPQKSVVLGRDDSSRQAQVRLAWKLAVVAGAMAMGGDNKGELDRC